MKAMVLAAGLGTRLRPLTNDRPKALVEIGGRTLLEIALTRLRSVGVDQVIVNVHHFPEMILEALRANQNFGLRVEISREAELLDTGGGLKQASWFFLDDPGNSEEPFFLHNVDIISTIDLPLMLRTHCDTSALATLAAQRRDSSRLLAFDDSSQLCGRRRGRHEPFEMVRAAAHTQSLAFCGVHVLSPRFLRLLVEEGAFSIIDSYLRLAGQGESIRAFPADEYYWRDLGKPEQIAQATEDSKLNLFS